MKIIIKFKYPYCEKYYQYVAEFIDENPLSKYSLGSLVAMKNSDYWLDYKGMNYNKLNELFNFINRDCSNGLKDNLEVIISDF